MTKPELVQRAIHQLNAGQPEPRLWPESEIDISACVLQASSVVAHNAMRDSALRGLLQQEYSVTLDGSGEGNLLAATGSVTSVAGEILIEGIYFGVVLDAEGQKLQPLFHYADFIAPQLTAFGYYLIKDGGTILTRARNAAVNTAFDIQSAFGPLIITASYTPASVDDFKPEFDDMLIKAFIEEVAIKVKPANANAR